MSTVPSLEIGVAVADDHQLMREGLRRLLEATPGVRVLAEAANGHQLLEALRQTPVDVAIVDLTMPGMTGMDLIRRVKTEFPQVAVLVLTMHAEQQYAVRAFRCGASGYLTKDSAGTELVQAIRKVAAGGGYVTAALAEQLAMGLQPGHAEATHASLSDREFEVLRLIVAGRRLTEIADELHLSVKTVSTHKTRILEKLGLDSTAGLIKYGLENRLLDDDAEPLSG